MTHAEKEQRLLDAAVAILSAVPGRRLNITVLNKALFYLDLVALRDLGHAITGNTFVALDHGPAVAHYQKRLVRKLVKAGLAEQVTDAEGSKPVVLVEGASPQSMTEDEVGVANHVASAVSTFIDSSKKASDYSHENLGWQIAYRKGQGAGRAPEPIDLHVALQQIAESDPWVDTPFDGSFSSAVRRDDPTASEW